MQSLTSYFNLDRVITSYIRKDVEFFPIRRARLNKIGNIRLAFERNSFFQVDLVWPEFFLKKRKLLRSLVKWTPIESATLMGRLGEARSTDQRKGACVTRPTFFRSLSR